MRILFMLLPVLVVGAAAIGASVSNRPEIDVAEAAIPSPRLGEGEALSASLIHRADDSPAPAGHPGVDSLPEGHPPLAAPAEGPEDAATITWKVPPRWAEARSASAMRIATYRVPGGDAGAGDAEVSVVRAGGSTEANVARWVAQFDEGAQAGAQQSVRTVRGLAVTVAVVRGTFSPGTMGSGGAEPKPGWALVGAVVETPGGSYFFKLTGPAATALSARAELDSLLETITPI